jgi:sortase A
MISKILFLIGVVCLGLYAFFTIQAYVRQQELEQELYQPATAPVGGTTVRLTPRVLKTGDLFGRLEVPRLNMSVMVMEGDTDQVLRLGAGRVPGTGIAIAGHRDTFFRPLKDIQASDRIRLTTPDGATDYRVIATKIVGPKDTFVLDNKPPDSLTLITCYPFYYIGPAPKRFIVEAVKDQPPGP